MDDRGDLDLVDTAGQGGHPRLHWQYDIGGLSEIIQAQGRHSRFARLAVSIRFGPTYCFVLAPPGHRRFSAGG